VALPPLRTRLLLAHLATLVCSSQTLMETPQTPSPDDLAAALSRARLSETRTIPRELSERSLCTSSLQSGEESESWTSDASASSGHGRRRALRDEAALLLDRLPSPANERDSAEADCASREGEGPGKRTLSRTLSAKRRTITLIRRKRRELLALIENGSPEEQAAATEKMPDVLRTLQRLTAEYADHERTERVGEQEDT